MSRDGVMGDDENSVLFITAEGAESRRRSSKAEIARQLALRIEAALA